MSKFKNGTLIEFHSMGNTGYGFVIGTCSYDNCGEDNAYVVRYAWEEGDDQPRRPYAIVAMEAAEPVKEWPEDFLVGGHWSRTPEDRCDEWIKVEKDGLTFIVPNGRKP